MLGDGFEVVERGALDGLQAPDVARLAPAKDDVALIVLLSEGTPLRVGKRAILGRLQDQITRLENEDVAATLLVCTGHFPDLEHGRPLLQPQAALNGVVKGLAAGSRIATMPPPPDQAPMARQEWAAMGESDGVVVVTDPYGRDPNRGVAEAATRAQESGAGDVFMDCFGFDLAMRDTAATNFAGPVVLARSMAARLLAEIAR